MMITEQYECKVTVLSGVGIYNIHVT